MWRFDWVEWEPLQWLWRAIAMTVAVGVGLLAVMMLYVATTSDARAAAGEYEQTTIRVACAAAPDKRCVVHRDDLLLLIESTKRLHDELIEAESRCKVPPEPAMPQQDGPPFLDGRGPRLRVRM